MIVNCDRWEKIIAAKQQLRVASCVTHIFLSFYLFRSLPQRTGAAWPLAALPVLELRELAGRAATAARAAVWHCMTMMRRLEINNSVWSM